MVIKSMIRAATAALALTVTPVWAAPGDDPGPLVTDRPDQTESSTPVPPGFYQLEFGWLHDEPNVDGAEGSVDALPQALLRIGVAPRWEVRVGIDGYLWADPDVGADDDGFGDASLGFKVALREGGGRAGSPEIGLLGQVKLPTGDKGFSSERADPSALLLVTHDLTDRLTLAYNVGVAAGTVEDGVDDRDTFAAARWTASLGVGLGDRLGGFVELFGGTPLTGPGTGETSIDGGLTYLVRDNLQLDGYAGAGMSDAVEGWFAGLGATIRWPR